MSEYYVILGEGWDYYARPEFLGISSSLEDANKLKDQATRSNQQWYEVRIDGPYFVDELIS